MSQAKVDRYKEEKKNREKNLKKAKVKKVLIILVISLCIGALLGIPLGKGIYKYQVKQKAANATIDATQFDEWLKGYYTENYYDLYAGVTPETEDEATYEDEDTTVEETAVEETTAEATTAAQE